MDKSEHKDPTAEREVIIVYAVDAKKPYIVSKENAEEFRKKSNRSARGFSKTFSGVKVKFVEAKEETKK